MDDETALRLQRVEAQLAIRDLKARYAELVDARFIKGAVVAPEILDGLARQIADLFAPDARWDGGPALGVAVGRAEIADRMRRPTLVFSRHVFTQPRITLADDARSATGRWSLICPCTQADGSSYWMLGEEHDTYAQLEGLWLHTSMQLRPITMAPAPDGWGRILG